MQSLARQIVDLKLTTVVCPACGGKADKELKCTEEDFEFECQFIQPISNGVGPPNQARLDQKACFTSLDPHVISPVRKEKSKGMPLCTGGSAKHTCVPLSKMLKGREHISGTAPRSVWSFERTL